MRFYRFWAPVTATVKSSEYDFEITSYGYSDESIEDALRVGAERAEANANRILGGNRPDEYYGGDRALREEVVDELHFDDQLIGVLTYNSYGALTLNTEQVFFADIDLPRKRWFSFRSKRGSFEDQLLSRIRDLVAGQPRIRLRLYRTLAGYRVILTSELIPATEAKSANLLNQLGSDSLYVALCKSQDSYRARLTPKPWRVRLPRPPSRFPFQSDEQATEYRAWQESYREASAGYATCALIAEFGTGPTDPVAAAIVAVHDLWSINDPHPLA